MTRLILSDVLKHIADQKRRYQTVSLSFEQADLLVQLATKKSHDRAGDQYVLPASASHGAL